MKELLIPKEALRPWRKSDDAPKDIEYCVAVVSSAFTCDWFFSRREAGRWYDNNTGEKIFPTHWLRLPPSPSEIGQ